MVNFNLLVLHTTVGKELLSEEMKHVVASNKCEEMGI